MTRKDYVQFAKVLKDARNNTRLLTSQDAITIIETRLIQVFREDNPAFDVIRFLDASIGGK